MARSQVIVSSGFAVLGLVVGLTVGALFGPGSHPQPLGVPDDSPVVVRGGSVEGLGATAWQKISSNPEVWELQGVDTTTVSMDGVIPSGTTTVQSVSASSLTTDWSLTLSFRDQGDHDNTDYQLQICTNPSCSTTGPLSKTLYLIDAGRAKKGKFDNSNGDKYDSLYRLRYDVQDCIGGNPDASKSHCDHIKTITSAGISFSVVTSSGTTSVNGPFACRAGACNIGIDK